jgi:hypothetical protein
MVLQPNKNVMGSPDEAGPRSTAAQLDSVRVVLYAYLALSQK